MSLKTDYYDGSTGLILQMDAAFAAGAAFVATNLTQLSNSLKASAAAGITVFTVTITTSDNPAYLRGNNGNNLYNLSYQAGIVDALAGQGVYSYEVSVALNTKDNINTAIDFNFDFGP